MMKECVKNKTDETDGIISSKYVVITSDKIIFNNIYNIVSYKNYSKYDIGSNIERNILVVPKKGYVEYVRGYKNHSCLMEFKTLENSIGYISFNLLNVCRKNEEIIFKIEIIKVNLSLNKSMKIPLSSSSGLSKISL